MPGDLIWRLPKSVKMIVEAGTGYNFDMATLREQHIMLTNIPEYSTQRVVHTAIMLMLSLASSLQTQIKMLALGNHANFEQHLMVDHGELNGKTLGVIGYGHI